MQNNKKHKQEGLSEQVHSEFETSVGNNFETVIQETPVKNNPGSKEEPLNLPDQYEYEYEWDRAEEPAKMSMGETKVSKMPMLIGLLGVIGFITVIGVANSLRVDKLKS
jgi:hypothetical protein